MVLDFVGIGFRRCGSSWMTAMLDIHPAIAMPASGIHYFSEQYDQGHDWYWAQLQKTVKAGTNICGEVSTSYSYPQYSKDVASRLFRFCSSTKIISIIRQPADRAYSDYLRGRLRGEIKEGSFADALTSHPEIVARGQYASLLKPYLERFGEERVMVIRFDDICNRPLRVIQDIYKFIGADHEYVPLNVDHRINSSRDISGAVKGLAWRLGIATPLRNVPILKNILRKRVPSIRPKRAVNMTNAIADGDLNAYAALNDMYRRSIDEAQNLLHMDLSAWTNER